MSKKLLAVWVTLAISLTLSSLAFFTSGKPTQIVEQDGLRTVEYHLFGTIPLPTRLIPDSMLRVSPDVRQMISSTIVLPRGMNLKAATMLLRTKRPSGTEYFAYVPFTGNGRTAVDSVKKQLKGAHFFAPPGMLEVEGTSPSGCRVRIWSAAGSSHKEFGVSVVDPKPAY
jgi:hypothetical protein